MLLKFYLASFIIVFFVFDGFAQKKQNVYFLKNNGSYVNLKDSADFIRVVQEPDSGSFLYNVFDYYPNGNSKMIGKSSDIDPIKLEGQNVSYYPDKNKKRVAAYRNGRIEGAVYDYYPNGKLYRTVDYVDNPNRSPELRYIGREEIVHTVFDSTGVQTVKDGTGHYVVFDSDYKTIVEEGDVKDGKRNGNWKGTVNKGKTSFTEEYADGKFIKGTSTDKNGNTINYTVKEALPTFKGGQQAFGNFLGQNIRYPTGAKSRNAQGRVIVGFVVEKDGSLQNLHVLNAVDPELSAEALRVLRSSPKWNPGIQHGVPVRVAYTIPINFAL